MLSIQWLLSTKGLVYCIWFWRQWLQRAWEAGVGGPHSIFNQPLVTQRVVFSPRSKTGIPRIPTGYLLCGLIVSLQSLNPVLMILYYNLLSSSSPFFSFFLTDSSKLDVETLKSVLYVCLSLCFSPCVCVHACMCMPEISLTSVPRPYAEILNFDI